MPSSPPRQARSRETLDRVLHAATELFAETGRLSFTLPEVAGRAGVSVGTVYRRFQTKEDLLDAILERLSQEERTGIVSRWTATDWAARPLRELTDRVVTDLSRTWRDNGALMRALMARRLAGNDDSELAGGIDVMRISIDELRKVVSDCGRPVVHDDPGGACAFAYRMVIGMCARQTADAVETRAPRLLSWDELIAAMSDAMARYLFGPDYATL